MDNYADASSDQATDYDLTTGAVSFSATRTSTAQCLYDRAVSRALDLSQYLNGTSGVYFVDVWMTSAKPSAG